MTLSSPENRVGPVSLGPSVGKGVGSDWIRPHGRPFAVRCYGLIVNVTLLAVWFHTYPLAVSPVTVAV